MILKSKIPLLNVTIKHIVFLRGGKKEVEKGGKKKSEGAAMSKMA